MGVGFKPTDACASAVFKTAALDHSATPPYSQQPDALYISALLTTIHDYNLVRHTISGAFIKLRLRDILPVVVAKQRAEIQYNLSH